MELVLASNFDDGLVDGSDAMPVSTFFGNFPVSRTGGGRPPQILPEVTEDRFRSHTERIHRSGRRFYATLNSNDLGLREYEPGFIPEFVRDVGRLLDLGADGFVVALPVLMEAIHREHPSVPISVSTFARVRSVTQAEYFADLGADVVVVEEANRDFAFLRGLVRRGIRVELLVNQTCIPGCPYRAHHLNTSSLASQTGRTPPRFEFPILQCGLEVVKDPARLVSGIFVRPEDLARYEALGIDRFKISGRNKTTDWLLRAARAYAGRRYDGDLLDILSLVQIRGPRSAVELARSEGRLPSDAEPFERALRTLSRLTIDNAAFPTNFLGTIAAIDCEHRSCRECGYCARVAEKVLRIDGRPPSAYAAPRDLPSPLALLPAFGPAD